MVVSKVGTKWEIRLRIIWTFFSWRALHSKVLELIGRQLQSIKVSVDLIAIVVKLIADLVSSTADAVSFTAGAVWIH